MPWNKEDRSFKTLINRRTTSEDKAYYEEFGDNTINVHLDEVWTQSVSSDTSAAITAGVAEQRTLLTLTEDITVGSQQAYYADESGARLKNWISEKYGSDYRVHLYENDNSEIFPTDPSEWFFDYQTGILTFNGSTAAFSKPFKITAYRYIGEMGATGIRGLTGVAGDTGTPGSQGTTGLPGVTGLQGVTGIQGVDGQTGLQGITGIQGIDGEFFVSKITGGLLFDLPGNTKRNNFTKSGFEMAD